MLKVEGDLESQLALRYSMFLLLSSAPFHSENLSIPARALSAQVYKGAVFWDTDIFMFPFFLSAFPEVARNLIAYRIHTLPGARKKAREYGFKGAFYPWEGQEGGHDACTLFNITDVFTGRPMRTYFRDKQIHISADVVWAVWQYAGVTGDASILWEGGFEVMLECARFFHSYAYRLSDESTFVLVDVTGPDEYHERVGNNAFTNYMVQEAVASTLKCATLLEEADPRRFAALREDLEFQPEEHARLREFAEHLVLPVADPDNGVIPQFDGYFSLEDCSLEALKSRVLDPNEYLGGGNGLATTTQILKQADVVLLMHLLPERFTREEKLVNWEYYEPRTEHGSSLSACAYALVAAAIGKPDFAYTYFLKTATIDLSGKSKQFVGTLYIGGTHPAANGGAWMVATQGFAGVRLLPDHVLLEPQLPRHWESLEFSCRWKGRTLHVTVSRDAFAVAADPANDGPVLLHFQGTSHACPPGASWSGPSL
jgi:nigerose phosphorylase